MTLIVGLYFGPGSLGCSLAGVTTVSWQLLDGDEHPIDGYVALDAACSDAHVGALPGAWYGLRVIASGPGGRFEGTCDRLLVGGSGGSSIRYPCTVPAVP